MPGLAEFLHSFVFQVVHSQKIVDMLLFLRTARDSQFLTQLVPSADTTPVNCGIGFLVVHYIFFYCLLGLGAASGLIDLLYLADGFGWLSQVDVFFVGG